MGGRIAVLALLNGTTDESVAKDVAMLSSFSTTSKRRKLIFSPITCVASIKAASKVSPLAFVNFIAASMSAGLCSATKDAIGLASVAIHGNTAAIVEVNSETDFVSKNEMFQDLVKEIASVKDPQLFQYRLLLLLMRVLHPSFLRQSYRVVLLPLA
jgi:hypothetical protein